MIRNVLSNDFTFVSVSIIITPWNFKGVFLKSMKRAVSPHYVLPFRLVEKFILPTLRSVFF